MYWIRTTVDLTITFKYSKKALLEGDFHWSCHVTKSSLIMELTQKNFNYIQGSIKIIENLKVFFVNEM